MNLPLNDGLLHLRQAQLDALRLVHLMSGMDDDEAPPGHAACGRQAPLSGYTEWICPEAATLTLGWDWQLLPGMGGPQVARLGLPRTNIQVLDDGLRPLPWERNLHVLAEYIDRIDWGPPAFEAVCQRPGN